MSLHLDLERTGKVCFDLAIRYLSIICGGDCTRKQRDIGAGLRWIGVRRDRCRLSLTRTRPKRLRGTTLHFDATGGSASRADSNLDGMHQTIEGSQKADST